MLMLSALVFCNSLRSPAICSCCCVCFSSSMVFCEVCNVCTSLSFVILSCCSSCVWLSLYCCVVRACAYVVAVL